MREQLTNSARLIGGLLISVCVVAGMAAEPGTDPSTGSTEELEEVVVSATRLQALRAEAIKAEDRLIARYNDLNKDDDLDIECVKRTPTGTRFSYRYCMVKLQRRLQQRDASDFMDFMHDIDKQTGQPPPLAEVGVGLMERWPAYRKNLDRLMQDDPQLRELVAQRAEALRKYESARRSRSKGEGPRPAESR